MIFVKIYARSGGGGGGGGGVGGTLIFFFIHKLGPGIYCLPPKNI